MQPVVPPPPRKYFVVGRPKTRAALRLSGSILIVALMVAWFRPDLPEPAVALLGGAAVAGLVALVLRLFERPRRFVEYRMSRMLGLPVVYVAEPSSHPSDRGHRSGDAQ